MGRDDSVRHTGICSPFRWNAGTDEARGSEMGGSRPQESPLLTLPLKLPRHHGVQEARIRLNADPRWEAWPNMPVSDYEGEGLAFNNDLVAAGPRDIAAKITRALCLPRNITLYEHFSF